MRGAALSLMEIASENPVECSFELLIREGVTKWIYRTVGITEKVREVEKMLIQASIGMIFASTESLDKRTNVVGGPADDECAQDERDGSQCFTGPIFTFGFLTLLTTPSPTQPFAERRHDFPSGPIGRCCSGKPTRACLAVL